MPTFLLDFVLIPSVRLTLSPLLCNEFSFVLGKFSYFHYYLFLLPAGDFFFLYVLFIYLFFVENGCFGSLQNGLKEMFSFLVLFCFS